MSKLKMILELLKLLAPILAAFKDEAWPILKQLIDLIKGKPEQPLVGAVAAASPNEVEEGVKTLVDAGVPEAEARESLSV